jgi:hypothetical protein
MVGRIDVFWRFPWKAPLKRPFIGTVQLGVTNGCYFCRGDHLLKDCPNESHMKWQRHHHNNNNNGGGR